MKSPLHSIILDMFALRGASASVLQRAGKKCRFLIPWTLQYELVTADRSVGLSAWIKEWFRKLHGLNFAFCLNPAVLILQEVRSGKPARDTVDHENTAVLKRIVSAPYQFEFDEAMAYPDQKFFVTKIPQGVRDNMAELGKPQYRDKLAQAKKLVGGGECSVAEAYLRVVRDEEESTTDLIVESMSDWHPSPTYRPKRGWVSYENFKLLSFLACKYCIEGNRHDALPSGCGLSDKTIENAYCDLQYLSLLPAADGIMTYELWVRQVAEAFFPDKTIISQNNA